ncbi:MAG TPA: ABC transporter permease subunit [Syntrophomonadaceae bacterium]|nr:ABC transporter permease subunit [Syntrophomonadaceae bacterium]
MSTAKTLFALLTKELRHNRGYFLVAVILLTYIPVIKSLFYLLQGGKEAHIWALQLKYILGFHQMIIRPGSEVAAQDTMLPLGMAVSILLGAILLGEERKGSLSYLAAAPVSRWSIVLSKFLAGSGILLTAMVINIGFLGIIAKPIGLEMYLYEILRWGQVTTLCLIALFTLALFTSILTASVLPAAVLSFFLIYLPGMLVSMAENIAARYFHISELISIKAQYIGSYLTITDYMTGEHWNFINSVDHDPSWRGYGVSSCSGAIPDLLLESMLLLMGIALLLALAILVFERLSLEEQGRFFADPRIRKVFISILGLLAGYIFIFPISATLPIFLVGLFILITALYGIVEFWPYRHLLRRSNQ